jgi:hypothetical protein
MCRGVGQARGPSASFRSTTGKRAGNAEGACEPMGRSAARAGYREPPGTASRGGSLDISGSFGCGTDILGEGAKRNVGGLDNGGRCGGRAKVTFR